MFYTVCWFLKLTTQQNTTQHKTCPIEIWVHAIWVQCTTVLPPRHSHADMASAQCRRDTGTPMWRQLIGSAPVLCHHSNLSPPWRLLNGAAPQRCMPVLRVDPWVSKNGVYVSKLSSPKRAWNEGTPPSRSVGAYPVPFDCCVHLCGSFVPLLSKIQVNVRRRGPEGRLDAGDHVLQHCPLALPQRRYARVRSRETGSCAVALRPVNKMARAPTVPQAMPTTSWPSLRPIKKTISRPSTTTSARWQRFDPLCLRRRIWCLCLRKTASAI